MPLSSLLLEGLAESGDIGGWQERQAKHQSALLDLQEKQRAMQANQQLRDLYAKGGQLDINQVMAIDPATGIELQKAQNSMFMQNLQAQDLQQKIQIQNLDSAAAAGFPSLVQYDADIASGMPQQQALQKFHTANGKVVSDAAKAGASWLQPGASYDPNQATPDNVRSANARFGRFTPHDKLQQESQIQAMKTGYEIQQKGAPSFSDRYFTGPDGRLYPNPYYKAGGQPQDPYAGEAPYSFTLPSGQSIKVWDLGSAAEAVHLLTNPADKEAATKWLDEQWQNKRNPTVPPTKQELEVEADIRKERGKLQVQDEQDAENKLSTIASMPSDEELMKYLNDATVGKGEEILKGPVASFFHVENKAQAADTVLGVLQENIKNIATKAKGDMNMQEVKNYESAVGALNNKDLGPQARFQAYLAAKNMVIKKIAMKHPEIAKKYGMGTATQAGAQQPQIPEPKTVEEARKLPKGTVFKVPGTGQLKIVD